MLCSTGNGFVDYIHSAVTERTRRYESPGIIVRNLENRHCNAFKLQMSLKNVYVFWEPTRNLLIYKSLFRPVGQPKNINY